MSADTFIWVDETGSDKRNALRKYAYSLRSVTPINYGLYTSGKLICVFSAISAKGVEDVYLAEGGVNDGDTFCDFIERCLPPVLMPFNGSNPRSIVGMNFGGSRPRVSAATPFSMRCCTTFLISFTVSCTECLRV